MDAERSEEPLAFAQQLGLGPLRQRDRVLEVRPHRRDLFGLGQRPMLGDESLHEVLRIDDAARQHEVGDDRVGDRIGTATRVGELGVGEWGSDHQTGGGAAFTTLSSSAVSGSTSYSTSRSCRARNTLTMQFMRSPSRVQLRARAAR